MRGFPRPTSDRARNERMTSEEFLAELETLDVGVVKERIATKVYLRRWSDIAQGWVERKEAELARQAHTDAQWANRIAIVAVVIAAISLILALSSRCTPSAP